MMCRPPATVTTRHPTAVRTSYILQLLLLVQQLGQKSTNDLTIWGLTSLPGRLMLLSKSFPVDTKCLLLHGVESVVKPPGSKPTPYIAKVRTPHPHVHPRVRDRDRRASQHLFVVTPSPEKEQNSRRGQNSRSFIDRHHGNSTGDCETIREFIPSRRTPDPQAPEIDRQP